jgi:hypothetical protein
MSPPLAQVLPGSLRIVLFGKPGAGKTSLLGALGQAGRIQENLLKAKLVDPSQTLESRRNELYENRTEPTKQPITLYPVQLQAEGSRRPENVLLIDCAGGAAADLLAQPQLPTDAAGSLADFVLHADAILVAIDAASPRDKLDADFAELMPFLDRWQEHRADRAEVGGLPVFLVLTKCDRLAKPDDSILDWVEAIEAEKSRVHHEFLRTFERRDVPFGRLDVQVWATAVQRPRAPEPYGVAELFRIVVGEARRYRARRQRSTRMLFGTLTGAAGVLTALLALMVVFLVTRPNPLRSRVPDDEPNATVRLAGPLSHLRATLRDLRSLESDPEYDTLRPSERERVEAYADEIDEYLRVYSKVHALFAPGQKHALAEVDSIDLPNERRHDWQDTELAHDLHTLEKARTGTGPATPLGWYGLLDLQATAQKRAAPNKMGTGAEWMEWRRRTEDLLERKPPTDDTRLDDSRITWGMVMQFREVRAVRERCESQHVPDLKRMLAISAALGLGLDPKGPEQPLDIRPPDGIAWKREAWAAKVELLKKDYGLDLTLAGLPEEGVRGIREAAKWRYEAALVYGRNIVDLKLEKLRKGEDESLETWERLRQDLKDSGDLDEWNTIAQVLLRLIKPDTSDPLKELSDFLAKKLVTLELKSFTLQMPQASSLTPKHELAVYYPSSTQLAATLTCPDDGQREGDILRLVYKLKEPKTIQYQLGQHISARVKLVGDSDRELIWETRRGKGQSLVFQYDCLMRAPYYLGDPLPGFSLQIPEADLPPLPDLVRRR